MHLKQQGKQIDQVILKSTSTRTNPLDSLVTAGTITQDQENTIQSAFEAAMKANRPSDSQTTSTRTNPLDSLVTAGTITQEQEDAMKVL